MVSNLQTKDLTTTDGLKYTYDTVPAKENKATVLLIHGYPATRHDWKHQIQDLSAAGYGVVAPDCLGYGDSDKPLEVEAYKLKRISKHITEILDKEGLNKVIGLGHDWGAGVLSRLAVWHPDRFEKFVFLSTGYNPPGIPMDVDAINANGLKHYGKMPFGYWYFFNSLDAPSLAASHVSTTTQEIDSSLLIAHSSNHSSVWCSRLKISSGSIISVLWVQPGHGSTTTS